MCLLSIFILLNYLLRDNVLNDDWKSKLWFIFYRDSGRSHRLLLRFVCLFVQLVASLTVFDYFNLLIFRSEGLSTSHNCQSDSRSGTEKKQMKFFLESVSMAIKLCIWYKNCRVSNKRFGMIRKVNGVTENSAYGIKLVGWHLLCI